MVDQTSVCVAGAVAVMAVVAVRAATEGNHVSDTVQESHVDHQPQKRSTAILEDENEVFNEELAQALADDADTEKRNTLFRFGKRGGSLFRFGKRGSLFRFGKRGGAMFRFGRSGAETADSDEDVKRTLFRYGKRADADDLRSLLESSYENDLPAYFDASKRQVDGFHWGKD